jgi:predicted dehydrogenase
MSTKKRVTIGMIGAGWWPNTMHMPALSVCEQANVVAVCDLIPERAEALAQKYNIPHTFTDYRELLASGLCEAVVVATTNDTHYPITMDALDHGLHVMCEKPLALNYAQASEMAATARKKVLVTCVPFTYRYMPSTRYLKGLVDEGYLGQPYHLHMRYYAAFARDPETYLWRFERKIAGSGALADIGSHFLHVAEWFYGEIEAVTAQLSVLVKRPLNPKGESYEQADDTAMVMLHFKNGAQGLVHASAIAYERTYEDKGYGFDQVHEWDFHGSDGTLRQVIDWDFRQQITADRPGDGPERQLTIPDRFWGDARRERVIETWEDVFRKQGFMDAEFVRAVANGEPMVPNFDDGARVQQLLDAAIQSAETGCWVKTPTLPLA